MVVSIRKFRVGYAAMVLGLGAMIASCADKEEGPVAPIRIQYSSGTGEGEVLIKLFNNGQPLNDPLYSVSLQPLGDTQSRLDPNDDLSMSLQTGGSWHFEWFDPAASDGGCVGTAPSGTALTLYNNRNVSYRSTEVHNGEGGPERHCIRPGEYRLNLYYNGGLSRSFVVEYQQLVQTSSNTAANVTDGVGNLKVASPDYLPTAGDQAVTDLEIHIDVANITTSDTPVLQIDSAGSNVADATFSALSTLQGTHNDYFRFNLRGSTTTWGSNSIAFLARFFWDYNGPNAVTTPYRDPVAQEWILNPFKHPTAVSSSRTITVGVDLKRPEEGESTTPHSGTQRGITIHPASSSCVGQCWINAENYTQASSAIYVSGGSVHGMSTGEWIRYSSVNFGSTPINSIDFVVGVDPCCAGKRLEIRLGSVSGTLIGHLVPQNTGSWTAFTTQTAGISPTTGTHDLYLVGEGGYGVANIDAFYLSTATAPPRNPYLYNIEGEDFDATYGGYSSGGAMHGLEFGEYVKYANVDFAGGADSVDIRLAVDSCCVGNGRYIELRLGSPYGTPIGSFVPASTGGWTTYGTVTVNVSAVAGTYDLYLVAYGGYGVAAIDYLRFKQ